MLFPKCPLFGGSTVVLISVPLLFVSHPFGGCSIIYCKPLLFIISPIATGSNHYCALFVIQVLFRIWLCVCVQARVC